jgi:hypothetical protein
MLPQNIKPKYKAQLCFKHTAVKQNYSYHKMCENANILWIFQYEIYGALWLAKWGQIPVGPGYPQNL